MKLPGTSRLHGRKLRRPKENTEESRVGGKKIEQHLARGRKRSTREGPGCRD